MIRESDRVSTVLGEDESLIDVFVAVSPAFERLRNPAMRKVMSRLVTVKQAAQMAGVDAQELVSRLNRGDDSPVEAGSRPPDSSADTSTAPDASAPPWAPAALRSIPGDAVIDVDVREDLRNGQEPFGRIMAARRDLPPGGALRVRAIFEPVPLYAVMEKQGLAHYTEELGAEDWSVWFYGDAEGAEGAEDAEVAGGHRHALDAEGAEDAEVASGHRHASDADSDADSDSDVVVLDVRELEPPEPMVRTLAALEELRPGGTLVQLNVRVPQFLLPQLEERGFVYEVREQEPGLVRVFITRNKPTE